MAEVEEEEEVKTSPEEPKEDDDYTLSSVMPVVSGRPQRDTESRKVRVDTPEERKSRFKNYLVYPVSAEPSFPGVVVSMRRYSDFKWLRDSLCSQFPGMFIPPLPPKKLFGNFDEMFVEERRVDLERFLNRVELIHPFHSNLAYTMFLCRPEASFKDGCKEVEAGIPSTVQEKTAILANLYPDLNSEDLHEEAEQDLVRIKEFFEKTKTKLLAVYNCCYEVLQTYIQSKNESLLLHNNLSELYHVEQNYPYRDSPTRLDVADEFQQWAKFHERQERYFKRHILRNIRYELQDVEAILEQILRVQDLQSQYDKWHKKAESWRNYEKDLTEKQEKQQADEFEKEKSYKEIVEICIKIVLLNDVESVWRTKIDSFKRDMYEYSNKAMQYYNEISDVWNQVEPAVKTEA